MSFYGAVENDEVIRLLARSWSELEVLKLSETSQKEKEQYRMFSPIGGIEE